MPAINKQPVFTSTPILVSKTFDPVINTKSYDLSSNIPTIVFDSIDSNGTLIERVTVSAAGDTQYSEVSRKLVYLCIYDTTNGWSLYKTAVMPAATVSDTAPNPEIEWVFTGGILLPFSYQLGILASVNYSVNNRYADYLAVTVEGSSYTTTT